MLDIKKILLPVDFPNASLPVISQAATLAHHFDAEIVMLHVMTTQSHAAGVPDHGPAQFLAAKRSTRPLKFKDPDFSL